MDSHMNTIGIDLIAARRSGRSFRRRAMPVEAGTASGGCITMP